MGMGELTAERIGPYRADNVDSSEAALGDEVMPVRLVIDTDIGTDVDDCLALAFVLGSPELTLEGVTCVYGDVRLRGRMVRKLLRLAGRDDLPVLLGMEPPLLGVKPIHWQGHEGVGLLEPEDEPFAEGEHAVDYLIRTVMENPGQIHLLAIGPLGNVALALRREPRIAQRLAHLTIMGGAGRGPGDWNLPPVEHNFACDPEAAHIVLSSGAPMTLIPLDVTTKASIRRPDVARIRAAGGPLAQAVAGQVEGYPRFDERGWTHLHDPLAAAVIARPDLVQMMPLRLEIETEGRLTAGMSVFRAPTPSLPANARVALRLRADAEAFIIERIVHAGGTAAVNGRLAMRGAPAD